MKILILGLMLLNSLSVFAGGSYKLESTCKDAILQTSVKITRSGIWDFLNTVPEKIEIFTINSSGYSKEIDQEKLYSFDGSANTTYYEEVNGIIYLLMWESDTYKYYFGRESSDGRTDFSKALLLNKEENSIIMLNCED